MKKTLLSLIALFIWAIAFAYDAQIDGIYYNLNDETKTAEVTSNINKYSGDITIPEKVTYNATEYSVTSIGDLAFTWCSSLTSITIPNSVISIGITAFYECLSLTSISIPNSVTSIGEGAFVDCSRLSFITIEATTPPSLGTNAFDQGRAIYIPDNTLSAYKSAWGTDYVYVNNETSLTINIETPGTLSDLIFDAGQRPAFVAKLKVTGTLNDDDFTCMHKTMTSLVDIDLSEITNTTGVDFNEKNNLVKIILPNNLTSIGERAFQYCTSLTSITIPNSVTSIGDLAFSGCSSLTSITIPNSVTSIGGYAFNGCSSLTSITIPNSVTSIGEGAFAGCSSLTSITIPNSVTSIGEGAFAGCSSLTSITIPNSVTSIGSSAFQDCSKLNTITCLGSTPPAATDLGANTQTCVLFVPKVAYTDYLRHAYWGQFLTIETIDVDYKTITAIANNSEWGSVEGGGYYDNGKEATLTAIPNNGYRFVKWDDEVTDNPRTVVVTQDSTFTAIFEPNTFTITTAVNNKDMGSVTKGGEYAYGTEITLTATANSGYRFTQWSDGNTDNPRTITVTENKTYTAEFEVELFGLYAASENPSMGGVKIILTAEPIKGFEFVEWTDGNTDNPRILRLTEDTEIYARFRISENTEVNLETSKIQSANVYTNNGILHVEGIERDYYVLDAAGRLIYSGRDAEVRLPRGVYMVSVGGEVQKVVL